MDNTQLKMRYLTANFIGLAMIGSVFLYAVVVEVLKRYLAPFTGYANLTPDQVQTIKYIFVALALVNFFVIKWIPKILGARSAEQLMTATIITLALCESVAVLGLVLFLLAGNAMDFYTFMFLSLFYFWFFFPKYQDWEARLQEQPAAGGKDA